MRLHKYFRTVAVCSGLLFLASGTFAADNAGKDSTKRVQQMLRKSQQEKAQLTQQKAEVESQLKDSQGKLEAAEKKASSMNVKVSTQAKELDVLKREKEELVAKLSATEKQLADTGAKLSQTEADRRNLETVGTAQSKSIATCEGKNIKLYQYSNELLNAYEHKGCGSALLQAEPLTSLKRVEIENLVEEYGDKLSEQKHTDGGKLGGKASGG